MDRRQMERQETERQETDRQEADTGDGQTVGRETDRRQTETSDQMGQRWKDLTSKHLSPGQKHTTRLMGLIPDLGQEYTARLKLGIHCTI